MLKRLSRAEYWERYGENPYLPEPFAFCLECSAPIYDRGEEFCSDICYINYIHKNEAEEVRDEDN